MNPISLDTKTNKTFRESLNIGNKNIPKSATVYIQKPEKSIYKQALTSPPEGFMTGDEFERRVKERVTKFYIENGLL